jgi:hypothetical protein
MEVAKAGEMAAATAAGIPDPLKVQYTILDPTKSKGPAKTKTRNFDPLKIQWTY